VIRVLTAVPAFLLLLASCSPPKEPAPPEAKEGFQRIAEAPHIGCEAIVSSLIDPAKLDTLKGSRAANSRLRKVAYWLEFARRQGDEPVELIANAQALAGYGGTPRAAADKQSLLRNLMMLDRLGCLTDDGMDKLRKGDAPTITHGPYSGDVVEVDHIIPRAIAPELDERLYNLEFMPKTMNRQKSDGIGQRQKALAEEWVGKGLLSREAADRVLAR
jgi:hypothetical protein